MSSWEHFPPAYRAAEVGAVLSAVRSGDCVSVVGLSGSGKSNFLGYLAHRKSMPEAELILADGNRLSGFSLPDFHNFLGQSLENQADTAPAQTLQAVDSILERRLAGFPGSLGVLLDLSPVFGRPEGLAAAPDIANTLRALRDAHKHRLTFVIATRHPFPDHTELSELLYGHTIRLGPLAEEDARWNVARFAQRRNLAWDLPSVATEMIAVTRGFPSFLRGVCEAFAAGSPLSALELAGAPAVAGRLAEFWADRPSEEELRLSGLEGLPLLMSGRSPGFDTARLTAKEMLLMEYFQSHPGEVCAKDDLIRAVWPEDRILDQGVRDDSLAQLVRRLREKIESNPADPVYILTVPGRGYRFAPDSPGGSHAR